MKKNIKITFLPLIIGCFLLITSSPALSAAKKQFVPKLTITEEYTDNYYHTENNKDDEFSTHYNADFSFGLIDKKYSLILNYSPTYKDYMDKNENDAWKHSLSLDYQNQMSKHTAFDFSNHFIRDLNRTVRSNSFEKHDTNTTSASIQHQFGKRNSASLSYLYEFDDYDNPNADEFKRHRPGIYFSYWFSPQFGIDFNGSFSNTEYEISSNDKETFTGAVRGLRNYTRHLDGYLKNTLSYTDQGIGDHIVFNPSIGFDWQPSEDSGISLGIGVLFQDYENQTNYDSEKLFLEFDIYKNISFSKRNNLTITGSSSYNDIDTEAASLGFTINYQAGVRHTYKLTRQLTSQLDASYQLNEYDEPTVDREDTTLNLGAGLTWEPLKWLTINGSYRFKNFDSDSTRSNYDEHIVSIFFAISPYTPIDSKYSDERKILEDNLFD